MKIGIAGPFNPRCVSTYFDKSTELPNIHLTASSVNIYVQTLLKLGHEVVVFTINSHQKNTLLLVGKNIKIYVISSQFCPHGFAKYRVHKRVKQYIAKELPTLDILHAQWTYEYALAVSYFAKQKPVFCSVRDWCPYILSMVSGLKNKYNWWTNWIMFRQVMNNKDIHFLANSTYTYNCIICSYPHNTVTIIPNAVSSSYIRLQRADYPTNPIFVSISQSLLNARKNYKALLHAFRQYLSYKPEAYLILIGTYTEEWKTEMQAQQLLEHVELKGEMRHEDIFDILDHASCLVHPSLEETFGNILLEAMCRRIPCIGGQQAGAVPQVLGQGKYGILCDVTNPTSIANAMKQIEDRNYISEIIECSTKYLENNYLDISVTNRHIELFNQYLA